LSYFLLIGKFLDKTNFALQGDHVDDMIDMTDEDIMNEALDKLRSIFDDVPEPTKYIVHNWLSDEFAKSAYSYNQEDYYYSRWYLRQSLPGPRWDLANARLHFAGEGTSDAYYGLIQGAIWEGERAAYDVERRLDFISNSDTPTSSPTSSPTMSPTMSPPPLSQVEIFIEFLIEFFQLLLDFLSGITL